MRVLGLETAGRAVSAALVNGEGVLAEAWLAAPQQHCRELVPLVDWCLHQAGTTLKEIDGFAVSLGPGSFTGLRIGLAVAKAMALATGKKLAGIPTFEVMAAGVPDPAAIICPVLPSRPGEIYAAFLRRRGEAWEYLVPPMALPPADLLSRLPPGEERVILLGEAASLVRQKTGASLGPRVTIASPVIGRLLAAQVAYLGREKLAAGAADDPWRLEPLYLRPPGITRQGR
jgi:tRNA threonylcarbamoyladenosine biosynthesis protein TsaB